MPPLHQHDSPRTRRLRSDLAALEKLQQESSIFSFKHWGNPPHQSYIVAFHGSSLARDRGKVARRDHHEVEIKLGAAYPRTIPEIRWLTPIYHPNISEIGIVCLGAYGTHWVPSLALDDLCVMLWDMARFQNYDIRSPYNREAAQWAASQTHFPFPIDARPLRDGRAALGRVETPPPLAWDEGAAPRAANLPVDPAVAAAFHLHDPEVDPGRPRDPLRQTNALAPDAPRRPTQPPHPVDEVFFLD